MQSSIDTPPTFRPAVKIIRADHLGMCFGVRDAIALAVEESRRRPLTILGELVHNESVLGDLRARGVEIEKEVAAVKTESVMITAHGASEMAIERARARGLDVIEATCPLVHHAHRALRKLVRDNFHPIVIGIRTHVEVHGMTEDLDTFDVVLTEADVARLEERPRFGVVAQTTQPVERVRYLVDLLRRKFPRSEVEFIDTVCQPTKQRQSAAIELASECDVVIVVGGSNSNNTRELAATCQKYCNRVHHVQGPEQLRQEWFQDTGTVGITAGTSTPDGIIDAVEKWLLTHV